MSSAGPQDAATAAERALAAADDMPRARVTRREALLLLAFVVIALAFLYFALPRLTGLEDTWNRIREGDPVWLVACLLCELISFGRSEERRVGKECRL